jgi:hypothetical protein
MMHTVFFGGMSLYTLDTVSMSLVQDTLIPFVNTISKITRDSTGGLIEIKLPENMPALKGTNAIFIPDISVPLIDGRILDLNAITGNVRVGYITGGIHSDAPNVASIDPVSMSRPNSEVYEVYINKILNDVFEFTVINEINNLSVYPNPASSILNVNFSLNETKSVSVDLYNLKGQLVKNLAADKSLKGQQHFIFSVSDLASGTYLCRVKADESEKSVVIRVKK